MSNSYRGTSLMEKSEFCYIDDRGAAAQIVLHECKLNGAHLYSASSSPTHEVRIRELQEEPVLNMYFSLEGRWSSKSRHDRREFPLTGAQHTLHYTPYFDGYYVMSRTAQKNFGIILYESFFSRLLANEIECLKRFWDKAQKGEAAHILPHAMPITPEQRGIISDMQQCIYTGHLRELFYESRILDLYLLQAEQAEQLITRKYTPLKPGDTEKLYAARQFVQDQLLTPLTLEAIARHAGLNDFKLKKGFKQLFGTSVFSYLNALRMNYALRMLRYTGCTVAEVAHTIGYGEPHNFTKAFKKYFGYLPRHAKGWNE